LTEERAVERIEQLLDEVAFLQHRKH
jgi:hypothetical protein